MNKAFKKALAKRHKENKWPGKMVPDAIQNNQEKLRDLYRNLHEYSVFLQEAGHPRVASIVLEVGDWVTESIGELDDLAEEAQHVKDRDQ